MPQTVFYMARTPQTHRAVTRSVQPPEFVDAWLESDDPAELRQQLAEADFIVTGASC